jgi:Protein of unknown function (DUF1120)
MNIHCMAISTLLCLAGAQHALAASTMDLGVKGMIVPTACTPWLSSSGTIDYGKISQQDLNVDERTRLPAKHLLFTLGCDGPSRFALRMRDNREGSALVNSEIYYGLGFDNSGNRLGVYSLSFDPTQTVADALATVYGTESTTGGIAWRTANLNPIDIGAKSYLGFTDTAGSTTGPAAIKDLRSTIKIDTVIDAKQNLDLSTDTLLNGSATLEVVYL